MLIAAAMLTDWLLGDPSWSPHPVRFIGALIAAGDRRLHTGRPWTDLFRGGLLATGVVALSALAAWIVITLCARIVAPLGSLAAVVIAWSTLAMRGLDRAADAVEEALRNDDLDAARHAIGALVGRDPRSLDRDGLVRAAVESVAENASDGVIAPLFYLFVAGPVGAIAYKAINTLDSMIGHRDQRYLYFGRVAARIDDAANFIPARLTAGCLIAVAAMIGRARESFAVCLAHARLHSSPNAGFPESAMAGALGIELGGDAVYAGEVEHRPALGVAERVPEVSDLTSARRIMRLSALAAFLVLTAARAVLGRLL